MAPPVFRFRSRTQEEFRLEGERVYLRHPVIGDYAEWSKLRAASRAFLEPWEPRWPEDDLTRTAYRYRVRRYDADREAGLALALFVFQKSSGRLVGGVTLGAIRRGAAECCSLGYWMGEPHAGKGVMTDALKCLIPHVFERMRLHRIEAACIPDNQRSQRLLEKAGFRREGYLNGYLKINGAWRDHLLYALIAEDWQSMHAKGSGSGG
ncbi:MAG: GNAT family N-acetyltransferase [Hoeflea sp.]|uniref:GNAT family N-acetyltransferase n=1 Tax=Hoeflea sp. TaxID=1940281 RepID=UPI001D508DBD|nr:GNAT family protein [Hoeflea sp.]MBU4527751.1 GNAT family N-acetyltransferase [Alphaproteobacteria bacterium]MBU4546214.1 GNAT family N-acetyltransferase [Alphaproteobacteria bacterium]MBU4553101.1 GNAT family N-acetyltransferase [Alphaproteobacteria bacterium]MBV1724173.1 GNAT family N-acetyltransferase [Hoeflea sp.]MBV1759858.1 GNAT family N-acetyltransferase [Hoeflea sp.]